MNLLSQLSRRPDDERPFLLPLAGSGQDFRGEPDIGWQPNEETDGYLA